MRSDPVCNELAKEAKSIVALCFRNGPIEDIHAGLRCPTCAGTKGYSRITDEEMRLIIRNAAALTAIGLKGEKK
jgi:hypothetical protein